MRTKCRRPVLKVHILKEQSPAQKALANLDDERRAIDDVQAELESDFSIDETNLDSPCDEDNEVGEERVCADDPDKQLIDGFHYVLTLPRDNFIATRPHTVVRDNTQTDLFFYGAQLGWEHRRTIQRRIMQDRLREVPCDIERSCFNPTPALLALYNNLNVYIEDYIESPEFRSLMRQFSDWAGNDLSVKALMLQKRDDEKHRIEQLGRQAAALWSGSRLVGHPFTFLNKSMHSRLSDTISFNFLLAFSRSTALDLSHRLPWEEGSPYLRAVDPDDHFDDGFAFAFSTYCEGDFLDDDERAMRFHYPWYREGFYVGRLALSNILKWNTSHLLPEAVYQRLRHKLQKAASRWSALQRFVLLNSAPYHFKRAFWGMQHRVSSHGVFNSVGQFLMAQYVALCDAQERDFAVFEKPNLRQQLPREKKQLGFRRSNRRDPQAQVLVYSPRKSSRPQKKLQASAMAKEARVEDYYIAPGFAAGFEQDRLIEQQAVECAEEPCVNLGVSVVLGHATESKFYEKENPRKHTHAAKKLLRFRRHGMRDPQEYARGRIPRKSTNPRISQRLEARKAVEDFYALAGTDGSAFSKGGPSLFTASHEDVAVTSSAHEIGFR